MLNWAKLYSQGRCREIGVSWTEEEMKKIVVDGKLSIAKVEELRNANKLQEAKKVVEEAKKLEKPKKKEDK